MRPALCFVQFIHPGGEHRPVGESIPWNSGDHARKFMASRGRSATASKSEPGALLFWGEWEPQSALLERVQQPVLDGPHHIFSPYYQRPASYHRLQNTDPFVFGERFLFTICQQHTATGPTQLRFLERGSVILFGSSVGRRFVLDTVFVVSRWIDHDHASYQQKLEGQVLEQGLRLGVHAEMPPRKP